MPNSNEGEESLTNIVVDLEVVDREATVSHSTAGENASEPE